jgi:protein gp37
MDLTPDIYPPFRDLIPPLTPEELGSLRASLEDEGCREPLITWHGVLLDGHHRLAICQELGIPFDVREVKGIDDEQEAERWIIRHQLGRRNLRPEAATVLMGRLYEVRKKESGEHNGNQHTVGTGQNLPSSTAAQIAAETGVSEKTVKNAAALVRATDALGITNDFMAGKVKKSRQAIIDEAAKLSPRREPTVIRSVSLEQGTAAGKKERAEMILPGDSPNSTFNYQVGDSIEWARWSWNPVTGCNHGCEYCYARDIANHYPNAFPHGFAPAFYPDRLVAPEQTKPKAPKPDWTDVDIIGHRNVFVCSMADLFGKWVPTEWIEAVLARAWANPQWNFLFLSKFPIRMADFEFPKNSWVGTSVDKQGAVKRAETAFAKIKAPVKWLSCEPMLERLTFGSLEMFDWVVIGGSSRSSQTPEFKPPFDWIAHLVDQARTAKAKVYFKTNLLGDRIQEYPS